MTTSSAKRHFPYQHPRFGTKNKPAAISSWRSTVYHWWWYCLKRNCDYLACCESGGVGPLAKLYGDFGDVRGDSFKDWWSENDRGTRLFAEPVVNRTVRVMQAGELVEDDAEILTLSLPLNLPKRFLNKRVREILSKTHVRKRGQLTARESRATYRVKHPPNHKSIEITMAIYDLHIANPHKPQWWLANQVQGVLPKQKLRASDTPATGQDKRRALSAAANRYLKKAREMIANTSKGKFV